MLFFRRKWLTTDYGSSYTAVEKQVKEVKNQYYLRRIAKKAVCSDFRVIAANSIRNQSFLTKLAATDQSPDVRIAALNRITDSEKRLSVVQSMLQDAKTDDFYRVQAIKAVIDEYESAQKELTAILSRTKSSDIALQTAEMLTDQDAAHAVFLRVAAEGEYTGDQLRALAYITGDDELLKIAKDCRNGQTALAAANRMSNRQKRQSALEAIAWEKRFTLKERYNAAMQIQSIERKQTVCRELMSIAEARVWQQSGSYTWKDTEMLRIAEDCRRAAGMEAESEA